MLTVASLCRPHMWGVTEQMHTESFRSLVSAYLHQDWETEFASAYEAMEELVSRGARAEVVLTVEAIDELMALPSEADRLALLPSEGLLGSPQGWVDAWLTAVRRRALQALSGDHSEPLVSPDGLGDEPMYDLVPPWSGGLLHGPEAEAVAAQVLAAHAQYLAVLERDGGSRSVVMRTHVGGDRTVRERDTNQLRPAPVGCVVQHWFRPRLHGTTVYVEPERGPAPVGFPALALFFSSYLRPGWWEVYDNPLEGVVPFRREQGPALTAAAVSELAVLQQTGDELDRQELLHRLGSYFVPRRPGETDVMLGALAIWLTQPGLDQ